MTEINSDWFMYKIRCECMNGGRFIYLIIDKITNPCDMNKNYVYIIGDCPYNIEFGTLGKLLTIYLNKSDNVSGDGVNKILCFKCDGMNKVRNILMGDLNAESCIY